MSRPPDKELKSVTDTTQYDVAVIRRQRDNYCPVVTVVTGLQVGKTLILEQSRTLIGRDADADLNLIDSGISRQHAELVLGADGRVTVNDLDSTNGVRVNGKQRQGSYLESGDRIQLGPETLLKFRMEDPDEVVARVQQYERSIRDDLTGIYNRRYFAVTLERELSYIRRRGTVSTLILLDVDHFKRVNDEFGHRGGDRALKHLTQTVATHIREEDVFARWGGEEFVLLMRGMDVSEATYIAERIRTQIEALRLKCGPTSLQITASFGVAALDAERHDTVESAMHEVDGYLYRAKEQGRNRTVGT